MGLLDGLISYWKLDEASGNRADSHGSNTLTDNNTVSSGAGKIGNAADFERDSSESLSRASNTSLVTGDIDFTFSLWVKFESLPALSVEYILAKEYSLIYNVFTSRFSWSPGGGDSIDANTFGAATTGVWYHVVVWHDAANNQIGIWVNGSTDTASSAAGSPTGSADFSLSFPFSLQFDGLMDEVGFWKRVLTSGERTALYNGGAALAYSTFTASPTTPPASGSSTARFVRRLRNYRGRRVGR